MMDVKPSLGRPERWLRRAIDEIRLRVDPGAQAARDRRRIEELEALLARYQLGWEPGHFYSPVPDLREVQARAASIFDRSPQSVPGVDLGRDRQLAFLDAFGAFANDHPFPEAKSEGMRYFLDNPNFRHGEAIVLQAVMRMIKPRRIVEIGSGFSSAAMLDINERYFGSAIEITFVEPYAELLKTLLKPGDERGADIIERPVQDAPLDVFSSLSANDIVFVDSSHVSKAGSDVNHIFFSILPALQKGVHCHIHDIGYPFEYPEDWIMAGRAWNEAYLLRAFLMYNTAFRINYYAGYLAEHAAAELSRALPGCRGAYGSSIWLERVAD